MALLGHLDQIFRKIDENASHFVENLAEAVAIESISAWPHKRSELTRMVRWTAEKLRKLGAQVELKDLGEQTLPDGTRIPYPPILLGTLVVDPDYTTVLVYGHLDVQPARLEDGWDSPPFVLTEKNGALYGRGSSDDKGPVLGWIHAIQTYQSLGVPVPVNLKFVFEAMEESGSEGLRGALESEKEGFLKDADYVCVTDSRWLGPSRPCLTYGLRGVSYYHVEIECSVKDLHSGVYGGTVHEAMTDLVYLLNALVTKDGKILIPHIYDQVAPLSPEEADIYKAIHFDVDVYKRDVGCKELIYEEKEDILMHRWRFPSLSIHGIEGAFSEPGQKTVIPRKVVGKFSIRTVPNQRPESVEKHVTDYITRKYEEYGSPNKIRIHSTHATSWTENPYHPHYEAAARATKSVYGVEPDLTREGGTVPVTLMLQEVTNKNVLILPIGASDDAAHAQNEKINRRNYIEGTKLLAAYLHEMGKL
ncbi:cytosolic non-specific dipeptidase-like [Cylas formicarius]|uniref:cytosolic non-specific dipeptidase-like n=1 Tax=Cylas formicarius TaxID=197179 RepID=UPI002958D0D5|nr:cytosolic non-specific dipeptidase-like [Cylas formicarius]